MLERRTPLRAKTGLKSRTPLKSKSALKRTPFERTASPKAKPAEKKRHEPSLVERLDRVFSRYIRLRDSNGDGMFTCISCKRILPIEYAQAGHFFTRHHMSVRWDERNVSAQCSECNVNKCGNLKEYEVNLRVKIGNDEFEKLCAEAHREKKWSHSELKEVIGFYKMKLKELSC